MKSLFGVIILTVSANVSATTLACEEKSVAGGIVFTENFTVTYEDDWATAKVKYENSGNIKLELVNGDWEIKVTEQKLYLSREDTFVGYEGKRTTQKSRKEISRLNGKVVNFLSSPQTGWFQTGNGGSCVKVEQRLF